MILHTLTCLCLFSILSFFAPTGANTSIPIYVGSAIPPDDIDSLDMVIFDLNKMLIIGQFIEIPVYIYSDDMINTLDFSMNINVQNLEYESIIDHTGEMQYAAYLNPNDLKLRFTSNSLSPYPVGDFKVVSIRFEVLSPTVHASDFDMIIAYLNGDPCSTTLEGSDMAVSTHEIITNETFINPNPAYDVVYVTTGEYGTIDIYDMQGRSVLSSQLIGPGEANLLDLHMLPQGTYTIRIITSDLKVKTQKITLL